MSGNAIKGMWKPSYDNHFGQFLDYQYDAYEAALRHTVQRRTAVDVGAHIGYFSVYMAQDFKHVWAFEPNYQNAEGLRRNLIGHQMFNKVSIRKVALGAYAGTVDIYLPCEDNSGSWEVCPYGEGVQHVTMETLDMYLDQIHDVGLIKIDVQNFEPNVLFGARKLIERDHPILLVEMGDTMEATKLFMQNQSYINVERIRQDMVWRYNA